MPVFRDYDKLKATMRRDLSLLLRKDTSASLGKLADDLTEIVDEYGIEPDSKVERDAAGATLKFGMEVPADQAEAIVAKVNDRIVEEFKFKEWSSMKV
jgi:hypothetical protein